MEPVGLSIAGIGPKSVSKSFPFRSLAFPVFVDQFGELIYGPGPICSETGETWTFHYGIETNIICRWHVDQSLYNFLKMVIQGQAVYRCRLKMSKDGSVYMPFPVAIWGGVEPAHIHCMNHYSWNFHASEGYLVGGAAYPLRDHYQLLEVGSLLTIHGPVKWVVSFGLLSFVADRFSVRWFAGHSYEPLKPPAGATTATPSAVAAPPAESAANAAEPAPDPAEQQPAAKPTLPPKPVPEPPAVAPQIPIQPIPNMNELSTRACKYGYGYYEPFIVGLYCFLSSVATGGLCFLFYVSFVKGEGASAGRKTK
jgi:hypothetical protein